MEIRAYFFGSHNANGRRKQRIQRTLKFEGRKRGLRPKTCYLPQRVYTSIGASRALQNSPILRDAPQPADDFALYGRFIGLNLPAVIVCPVVGYGELEMAHAGRLMDWS